MKKRGRESRDRLEIRRLSQRPSTEEFEGREVLKQRTGKGRMQGHSLPSTGHPSKFSILRSFNQRR